MFSIDIDGKRHAALTYLEALELLTGAGYADEGFTRASVADLAKVESESQVHRPFVDAVRAFSLAP